MSISPFPQGAYSVSASDDLPVTTSEWLAYGGKVEVEINQEVPGNIRLILTGPRTEIPGVPGPYYFGVSDGETRYPVLSVTGNGVQTTPQIVNVASGADHDKTTQEVAFKVDNFAHQDVATIFKRVTWALTRASGPLLTLNTSIPTSAVGGFGLTAGALLTFKESRYRIVTAVIQGEWVAITAVRHVTVEEFDDLMAADSVTVGDFDTFWSGNDCEDLKIKPLRRVS